MHRHPDSSLNVYVDGAGGQNGGYGYFVQGMNKSSYVSNPGITNNQAEYMAIIKVLEDFEEYKEDEVTIYSDSKNTVNQLNHEYAINDSKLRELAMKAWELMSGYSQLQIKWIPRRQNLAGKMLGS